MLNLGGIEVYAIASKREGQMQANPESQCLFIVQIQEMLLNQLLIYKRKIHWNNGDFFFNLPYESSSCFSAAYRKSTSAIVVSIENTYFLNALCLASKYFYFTLLKAYTSVNIKKN